MPIFISRVLARMVFLRSWATPVIVFVFVFATAWPLMALAEGPDNPLVDPANYWWIYVIIGGIATLTTIFTKLAAVLETARGVTCRARSPSPRPATSCCSATPRAAPSVSPTS